MATIVTRSGKGSPLTNTEVDSNFTNLNSDKIEDITGESIGDLSDVSISTASSGQVLQYNGTAWVNSSTSGIGNVVEDTTPQLGGDLDSNGNDITFGDSDKAIFGDGSDLQIYHSGFDSYVEDTGTGALILKTNGASVAVMDSNNDQLANFNTNGSVYLKHVNTGVSSNRLQTTSTGIDVTGNVTVSGTVDGRDIATDGTKLDGIESGATADQTAQEIATAIDADATAEATLKSALGLGTAAYTASTAYATAAQGALADSALQDITGESISDLSDVVITTVADNDLIAYDSTTSKYINQSAAEAGLAGLASPTFTGTPSAPTAISGTNTTQIATTAFVSTAVSSKVDTSGDTMTGNLSFGDSVYATFGASNDLQIYHDGTNSIISDAGTGNLVLASDGAGIQLQSATEFFATFSNDAGCDFYYDNVKKLETAASGVAVTGDLAVSGKIGKDSTDYITFTDNTQMDVYVNGVNTARFESDGDFHATADIVAYSTTPSDIRLKDNINVIDNALDKVKALTGYTFTYKNSGKESAGIIAQELESVLPQAVTDKEMPLIADDGVEYKTVNYDALHAVLIEAVKELTKRVEELEGK